MGEDTPPATPAALHPTLTTVSRQVTAVAKQIAQARNDIDTLASVLKRTREDLNTGLRSLASAPPESSARPAAPRPSMAAKAASTAAGVGRAGLLWAGGFTVAGELLSFYYPHLQGPLGGLLRVFTALLGGPPQ